MSKTTIKSLRGETIQRIKAASTANMRLVLPAAVIRSALFLPEGELVDDGLRSPEVSVVVATVGFDIVLCKTRKQMLWNGMIGAKE